MVFEAEIGVNKHKLMWSKSIASLSNIAEAITFTITKDSISLSATNTSKTSYARIHFKKTFFNKFSVDFNNILPEGYDNGKERKEDPSYSFLINSRHMATLFKSLDSGGMKYVSFRINWSRNAPINSRYKLLIEIHTKKLIVKKFQASYTPATKQNLQIASTYKDTLSKQQEDNLHDKTRINHIMMDQVIPKQFLEMVPASAEDFKIDIKSERISLCGYTKQIIKDRDYLKQPMAVTVTISLEELTDTNLLSLNSDQEPIRKQINFGMRDFKNFLNLANFFTTPSSFSERFDEDYITTANNDYFHIFFRNPGDPILFDLQNHQHAEVQFIQITSEDKSELHSKEIDANLIRKNLTIEAPIPQKIQNNNTTTTTTPSLTRPMINTVFGKPSKTRKREKDRFSNKVQLSQGTMNDDFDDGVTYGLEPERERGNYAETDYSNSSGEESKEPPFKKHAPDQELGPTQLNNKPKSIF
ncbi:DNA damage checkpoint protein, putative [Candida dubliniensis CD36]|uniref:DNA repair protein rad9 n=1 Tax=Candida dubliniensis (strain CD36 / ATCC MYA-646 / CBS 7987 / NCPF 3949 / NRRL Y-17841) TaxID=573826 RepID=B9WDM2_CANDC|nr:DNA damage checkpoint protein, putative [Candida dubliniensis CD36]CAX42778.1 DNA damage checkpoint protein, putative [Candida dubliniensis CD36]